MREFDAERAVDAYARRDYDRMEELVASVLDRAAPTEIVARGRALVARAVLASEREDSSGAAALEEAAALFGAAGETRWRGEALGMLAFRFRFHAGELEAAARTMAEALACLPGPSPDRDVVADASARRSRPTPATSREADAALREAEATGRALGDRRSLAYAAWVGAQLATVRRDAAVATQRFLLAEQQGGYEPGSGLLLVAEAACSLIRLDEPAAGHAYLERAETQAAALGFEVVALLPRGLYESRYGDPARAEEALAAYQAHEERQMAPRDEWRILLERAWAARRRGDERAATTLAARAFEAARARGLDDLPALHEPDLLAELAPLATAAGSAAARAVEEREPTLGVVTLGRLRGDGRRAPARPAAGPHVDAGQAPRVARDPVPLGRGDRGAVAGLATPRPAAGACATSSTASARRAASSWCAREARRWRSARSVEVDVRLFAARGASTRWPPTRCGASALARTAVGALRRRAAARRPLRRLGRGAARGAAPRGCSTCSTCWPTRPASAASSTRRSACSTRASRIEPFDEARYLVVRRAPADAAPPRQRPRASSTAPSSCASRFACPVAAPGPAGGGDAPGGRRARLARPRHDGAAQTAM